MLLIFFKLNQQYFFTECNSWVPKKCKNKKTNKQRNKTFIKLLIDGTCEAIKPILSTNCV